MTKFIASCLFATSLALNLRSYQTEGELEEFNNGTATAIADYYHEDEHHEEEGCTAELVHEIADSMWDAIGDFGEQIESNDFEIRQAHGRASESLHATFEDMMRISDELERVYWDLDSTLMHAIESTQHALSDAAGEIWVLVGHDEEKSHAFGAIAEGLQQFADQLFDEVRETSHMAAMLGGEALEGIEQDMHQIGEVHAADEHQWSELSMGIAMFIEETAHNAENLIWDEDMGDEARGDALHTLIDGLDQLFVEAHEGTWEHFEHKRNDVDHLIQDIYQKGQNVGEALVAQRDELEHMAQEFEGMLHEVHESTQQVIGDCADMNNAADHVFLNMVDRINESAGALIGVEEHAAHVFEEAGEGLNRNQEHLWNALDMHQEITMTNVDHIFNVAMDLVGGFREAVNGTDELEEVMEEHPEYAEEMAEELDELEELDETVEVYEEYVEEGTAF